MYLNYFGLRRPPFRITPDPDFFFPGGNRGAVLEALVYAVTNGEGIVKVVGEVGSGKTMLSRMLARELPGDCTLAFLPNPNLSPQETLQAIAYEFELDIQSGLSKTALTQRLNAYLLGEHARGRRVVLFIEEAQGMPPETLEEIRLLSNLETSEDKLLQIVLFGQPELDEKINGHGMRQLKERITYGFDLPPLTAPQVGEYLASRLRASGYRGNGLFSKRAIRQIVRRSRGLLRRINVLADKSLLAAYADGARAVEVRHVRQAAADSEYAPAPLPARLALVAGVTTALVAGLALFLFERGVLPRGGDALAPAARPEAGPSITVAEGGAGTSVTVGIGRPPGERLTEWNADEARVIGTPPAARPGTTAVPPGFGRLEAVAPELEETVTVDTLTAAPVRARAADLEREPPAP